MTALVALAACFLAYANGANDNFKGVASLFGAGVMTYRRALAWATAATAAGSLASLVLGQALLARFTGRGLVSDALASTPEFALAVAAGAGLTVLLATLTGFPISTTHGLTGAMAGAGLAASGTGVDFSALGKGFVLPLLLSPMLAVAVAVAANRLIAVSADRLADTAHTISAGAVAFARGLNDTPKIVAILLAGGALPPVAGFGAAAAAMALGGLLHSRRIAETMGHKLTALDHRQGLAANLSTSALVIAATAFGLPVSTTHVSVGSLFGIGASTGQANRRVAASILLSWVLTLPVAAALAATAMTLLVSRP